MKYIVLLFALLLALPIQAQYNLHYTAAQMDTAIGRSLRFLEADYIKVDSNWFATRYYAGITYAPLITYLIPSDSTRIRNYSGVLYLKNADSTRIRNYSSVLYLKNADSTTLKNSLLKNADSTKIRNYSSFLYLKNADSTKIRNYSSVLYAPIASPTFTGTPKISTDTVATKAYARSVAGTGGGNNYTSGAGPPDNGDGSNGDIYYDTTNLYSYRKIADIWRQDP